MQARMKRHLHVGPGGWKCTCCFPARSSKARKYEFRRAKRREAREAIRCEFTHGSITT